MIDIYVRTKIYSLIPA